MTEHAPIVARPFSTGLFPPKPFFQPKLTVNAPGASTLGDAYEREADRVADQVMRMPTFGAASRAGASFFSPPLNAAPRLQRRCAACEHEEKAGLQRKETTAAPGGQTAPPPVLEVLSSGGGQPLDADTRGFMESRLGQDFSAVRVHTDARAAESAAAIQARAYTSGRDVVFGSGEYQPSSETGKRLLAHELVHVGQQRAGIGQVQREGFGDVRIAEGYHETITRIKASAKFNSLSAAQAKLTGDLILEIEKKPDWPTRSSFAVQLGILFARTAKKVDLDAAKAQILTLGLDPALVTALLETLSKPLLGYVASGFDFSSRFLKHAGTLGFSVENAALGSYKAGPYDRNQPASVTNPAEESFKKSDILFFSGHQYAQYREPGTFTDDESKSCFNVGMISQANQRVKLVVSTSCATICQDVAKIWQSKFPDALILGYRFSAPLNGAIVADAFAKKLLTQGPLDLADAGSLQGVRDAWKSVVLGKGSVEGGPGLLYGSEVEIWEGGKWVKKPWNDKANACHYH